jgi:four helix bundle protein
VSKGVWNVEDLEAWQLADELKREVFALTDGGSALKDFKFRDQIRDAASSARRNISEGFGRFYPGDFARFMDFSIASTMEVRDCLLDGVERGHFHLASVKRATSLATRSLQVSKGLKRYLRSCRAHPFRRRQRSH